MAGREGERAVNDRHNIEKIHQFEFEHPLLWNQCYVTLLEKDRWKRVCVRARTGMNSVSAEPNVRPIKVYWDQVVLVSLKVDRLVKPNTGLSMMVLVATVGALSGWI